MQAIERSQIWFWKINNVIVSFRKISSIVVRQTFILPTLSINKIVEFEDPKPKSV